MKRTERNIEDMLERSLPSLSEEQLESARERIINSVRASAVAGGEDLPEKPVTEFDSARKLGWRRFAFVGAAAAALIATIWIGVSWQNVYARLETADGSLYRISEKEMTPVRTGERIGEQEIVRSDGGSGATLVLADGSRVEMRSQSELSLERADGGVRIRLNRGGVIVNAAKQRAGRHLYVQTKDMTVSVVGTIFLVNA
jgi:ferric-dicitrate binding protein FerR (iron transport regulator)